MPTERQKITVPDFAHRAHLRYQAALDVVLAGEVEAEREGRRWMVFVDTADAWLARRQAAAARATLPAA